MTSEHQHLRSPSERRLIVGVGNPYRSDDAVGLVVVRRLKQLRPAIPVIELSGEGTQLIDRWQYEDHVILVDAVRSGSAPGRVHRLDARKRHIPSDFFNYSTHAFSVAEAVELSRELGILPAKLIIFGVEGRNFTAGEELSPEVAAAVDLVVNQIVAELADDETRVAPETQEVFHA